MLAGEDQALFDELHARTLAGSALELTAWHRDYTRAGLREALVLKIVRLRPGRNPVYGRDLLSPLNSCWAVLRWLVGAGLPPAPSASLRDLL